MTLMTPQGGPGAPKGSKTSTLLTRKRLASGERIKAVAMSKSAGRKIILPVLALSLGFAAFKAFKYALLERAVSEEELGKRVAGKKKDIMRREIDKFSGEKNALGVFKDILPLVEALREKNFTKNGIVHISRAIKNMNDSNGSSPSIALQLYCAIRDLNQAQHWENHEERLAKLIEELKNMQKEQLSLAVQEVGQALQARELTDIATPFEVFGEKVKDMNSDSIENLLRAISHIDNATRQKGGDFSYSLFLASNCLKYDEHLIKDHFLKNAAKNLVQALENAFLDCLVQENENR